MHPVLFEIGGFEVRSYGFMLALSFILGIWLASHRAKKWHIEPGIIFDMALLIMISSVVGSRLMYVIFHLDEFRGRWLDIINPLQSTGEFGIAGLTVMGGFLLAIITTLSYLWIKKQPVLKVADIIAPSVALGIMLTRIGCFLNGCCFGQPSDSACSLVFPENSPAGYIFPNQTIIPTQLYSSLYGLIIFATLLISEKKFYRFQGFTFYLFFALYGIARFVIDFFRYYEDSMQFAPLDAINLSVNQGVSLILVALFGGLFIYKVIRSSKQQKKS